MNRMLVYKYLINRKSLTHFGIRIIFFFLANISLLGLIAAQSVNNTYYTPLQEANLHATLKTFTTAINRSIGNEIRSTISVAPTENGAVIYYDHWEDGYEVDIENPVQSTTEVWGDGNTLNGDASAVCTTCAGDLVDAGDIISLDNNVTLPRNPSQIKYDGRDKIGSTKFLALSQSGYALTPGPVLAGAVEILDTSTYDLVYELPIGENTSSTDMFEHVSLFVMAAQDNTTIDIDTDGNGSTDITTTINQGESYYLKGKVTASASDVLLAGATVTADKPIQAHILTGDLGGAYEARFFTLYPRALWDNCYYNPVGTTQADDPVHVFLYNPNGSAITVNYSSLAGSGSFSIPAGDVHRFVMPANSGAHFYSALESEVFFAMAAMDADNSNATHDWGLTLLPEGYLTNSATIGWGPGTGDLSSNGSPIWVTAIENTTIYADFDNDPSTGANTDPLGDKYDVSYTISPYQSQTIYDNSDNDQTGTRVYTVDGTRIAVAWGQDPSTSAPGNPYLDLGTTVPPERKVIITKTSEITLDADMDGLIDIGDEVTYSINVFNLSLRSRETITVTDTIPAGFDYITSSTKHNSDPIPDDAPTAFPLDEGGYLLGDLLSGDRDTLSFRVMANASALFSPSIGNTVYVNSSMGESWVSTTVVPVDQGSVTACTLEFTDNSQVSKAGYEEGEQVCITIDDNDENTNTGTAETLTVTVKNTTTGDRETITLTETGNNTGVFTGCITASASSGTVVEDGTLNASANDNLSADYTDPTFGDQCNDTAIITPPTFTKQLYLIDPAQGLDRIDPVNTSDGTTAKSDTLGIVLVNAFDGFESGGYTGGTGWAAGSAWTKFGDTGSENEISTDRARTGTYAWRIEKSDKGISRGIDLSAVSSATIEFYYFREVGWDSGSDFLELQISPDGSTWTTIYTSPSLSGADSDWQFVSVAVTNPALMTANSEIRFETINTSGSNEWVHIDDIFVDVGAGGGGGGGGTTSATFTQATAMCSNLEMPANASIGASIYLEEIMGPIPASPEISAVLKYGTTIIDSLINPSYNSGTGLLSWSKILSSNTTIPAGSTMELKVEVHETGYTFRIEYDSDTKPSKIDLPVTTVITLDNMEVYDAAYSGGSTIGGAFNGEQAYIRATASDPFGYYDITTLDINITDPNNATSTVTAIAVDSSGCSKTFEYCWSTPGIEGNYNLETVVKEGYENMVADTAATTFSVSFNDLGSPCALSFTDASGVSQNSYAGDAQVCLEINEADKNTDSGVAETISASITSASGDTETITLTETGINTGIFRGCINSSSTVVGSSENGTLYAPAGDVLSGNYTDMADPGDMCSDDATISTATPDMAVSKTLITPSDGTAEIGDFIQFDIVVSNPGPTTLTTVNLADTYDNAAITFDSASVVPTASGGGSITWNGLGPIASGGSLTISTYFTAAGNQNNSVNSISGTGTDSGATPVSAGPSTATVNVTQPRLSVTKTLDSPVGNAYVGNNLVYTINLQNTGTTTITTVPLSDFYPSACLEFVSATTSPDAIGGGILLWDDLGSLAASASTSVTVTFSVTEECNPIINTADISFAVDENGDAVPADSDEASKDIQLPPTAGNDEANTTDGVGATIDIPANDTDPNGNLNVMSVSTTGLLQPSNGTTTINGTTGEITYTPTGGFSGIDQFEYAICDDTSPTPLCDTATVTVNVQCTGTPSQNILEGNVFNDANQDGSFGATESGMGSITVYLYEDVNESGAIEGLDILLDSVNTAGDGTYSFSPTPGSFPIQYLAKIDVNDMPSGALMTTDNAETAYFTTTGQSDCNNNFGFLADADLSLTKTANLNTINVGQVLIFTITVSNAGPAPATGVEVTDILPAEFTFTNDDSGGNYNAITGIWTVGTIANGGTATINISATANAVSTPTNIAQVTLSNLSDPNSTPNNNNASEDDQASVQVTIDCTVIKAPMTIIKN